MTCFIGSRHVFSQDTNTVHDHMTCTRAQDVWSWEWCKENRVPCVVGNVEVNESWFSKHIETNVLSKCRNVGHCSQRKTCGFDDLNLITSVIKFKKFKLNIVTSLKFNSFEHFCHKLNYMSSNTLNVMTVVVPQHEKTWMCTECESRDVNTPSQSNTFLLHWVETQHDSTVKIRLHMQNTVIQHRMLNH